MVKRSPGVSILPLMLIVILCVSWLTQLNQRDEMTYDEMGFDDVFDGIWACASLIHLTEDEMRKVMKKLVQALKENGVLYFSVHKGDRDGIYHGRYFHDYTRRELQSLMEEYPELEVVDIWTTQDVRSEKSDKLWLNVLARKTGKE